MDDPRDTPPGWTRNPAAWSQRLPIVGLALVGLGIALYLALFQWGVVGRVWEPFFPGESAYILKETWISRLLGPVSDAFLGALAYAADAVTGLVGGRGRWRTRPWIVVLFGVLVVPLGAVSVALVMAQPLLFDAWCTLCLASAAVSLLMIGPAVDELLASLQYLRRARGAGLPLGRVFWRGGPRLGGGPAPRPRAPGVPWGSVAAAACAAAGAWLLAAPAVLGYADAALAAASDRVVGPIVVTFSTVAIWEVARPARVVSLVAGLWLVIAPGILDAPAPAVVSSVLTGVVVVALSSVRGRPRQAFGGGWRALWGGRPGPPAPGAAGVTSSG